MQRWIVTIRYNHGRLFGGTANDWRTLRVSQWAENGRQAVELVEKRSSYYPQLQWLSYQLAKPEDPE